MRVPTFITLTTVAIIAVVFSHTACATQPPQPSHRDLQQLMQGLRQVYDASTKLAARIPRGPYGSQNPGYELARAMGDALFKPEGAQDLKRMAGQAMRENGLLPPENATPTKRMAAYVTRNYERLTSRMRAALVPKQSAVDVLGQKVSAMMPSAMRGPRVPVGVELAIAGALVVSANAWLSEEYARQLRIRHPTARALTSCQQYAEALALSTAHGAMTAAIYTAGRQLLLSALRSGTLRRSAPLNGGWMFAASTATTMALIEAQLQHPGECRRVKQAWHEGSAALAKATGSTGQTLARAASVGAQSLTHAASVGAQSLAYASSTLGQSLAGASTTTTAALMRSSRMNAKRASQRKPNRPYLTPGVRVVHAGTIVDRRHRREKVVRF